MEKPRMQISVRSYLTAGMTAVVGASAIAIAPALPSSTLPAVQVPAPAIAEIALAGTSLPLEQIWTLLQAAGTGGSPKNVVNVIFSAVGTEFATQASPLVTAAARDVVTYLSVALMDVFSFGGVQVDFPGILSGVGTALGAGDVPGALQTLTGGLSAPITNIVQTMFGPDFQAFLTNKVGTVLGALPEILRSSVQKVLGLDIKPVTDAIAAALSGLVPKVAPGAGTPAVLASAENAPTIGGDPTIRPTEPPASASAAAAAAPGSAASVPVDVADEPTPAPAVEDPAPTQAAAELAGQAEPVAGLTPPRVAHRGAAGSADDAGPVARHRGAVSTSS